VNVPDCGTFRHFVSAGQPQELQMTGWLEVERLGDAGAHRKKYICPEHAKLLRLDDKWTAPTMRFSDDSAMQAFIDEGAKTYRCLDSGDLSTKQLPEGKKRE
jgi:hypothetical protein